MKIMHSKTLGCLTAMALSVSLLGVAGAQQESFPRTGEQATSCNEVDWNRDMTRNHPRLIEACREVVTARGEEWARFEAQFMRVESDGTVSFSVRDSRDRQVEEVTVQLAQGQVAYIDGRPTPFSELRRDQRVNLYVPEGQYGFVTQPGESSDQMAEMRAPTTERASETRVATAQQPQQRRDSRADRLPATAGLLPWFAVGGLLSLLGAGGLRLTRRR